MDIERIKRINKIDLRYEKTYWQERYTEEVFGELKPELTEYAGILHIMEYYYPPIMRVNAETGKSFFADMTTEEVIEYIGKHADIAIEIAERTTEIERLYNEAEYISEKTKEAEEALELLCKNL